MTYYTYRVSNSLTGQNYFGSTNDLKKRWINHRVTSKTSNRPLYVDMRELGVDNFYMERLGTYESKKEALVAEDLLIQANPSSYNLRGAQFDDEKAKEYSREYQREFRKTEECKVKHKKYSETEKFKAKQKEYQNSEKGKAKQKEYQNSDKYKAYRKEYMKVYNKEYREAAENKDSAKVYNKKYRKTEVYKAIQKRYRDKKKKQLRIGVTSE